MNYHSNTAQVHTQSAASRMLCLEVIRRAQRDAANPSRPRRQKEALQWMQGAGVAVGISFHRACEIAQVSPARVRRATLEKMYPNRTTFTSQQKTKVGL